MKTRSYWRVSLLAAILSGAGPGLAQDSSPTIAPPVVEMYPGFPAPVATTVTVAGVADRWEGASRPGHFDGVATVVALGSNLKSVKIRHIESQ